MLYGAGPHSIEEANAHRADERLPLSDLRKATEVVALTLHDDPGRVFETLRGICRLVTNQLLPRIRQPLASPATLSPRTNLVRRETGTTGETMPTRTQPRSAPLVVGSGGASWRGRWS